ncbi:hypothetical protein [Bacillus toyonensis]|nr:hypothetical protein [Bacillus toyonensis]
MISSLFFIILLMLTVFVAVNDKISDGNKTGYFLVVAGIVAIMIIRIVT